MTQHIAQLECQWQHVRIPSFAKDAPIPCYANLEIWGDICIQRKTQQAKVNVILLHIHTIVTTVTMRNEAKIYEASTSQTKLWKYSEDLDLNNILRTFKARGKLFHANIYTLMNLNACAATNQRDQ
jgi:hypothetical protein